MKTKLAVLVALLSLHTLADGFYPNGSRMVYAGYSGVPGRDLTNGFTVAGPVYGAQEKFMQLCIDAGYPVIPQLNNNLTFNDKATNKYVVVEQDLRARLTEQIDRYKGYTNIVWWSLTPEELRPWRKDEMKYLDLSVQMIRELDPLKRPIFMYHPNHRGIPELTTFAKSFDVLGKGRYVNSSGKKRSRQWVRQGVEEELEAIRLAMVPAWREGRLLIGGEPAGGVKSQAGFNNFISWSGLDIGRDRGSAVSALYEAPFEFSGRLQRVTVTLDAPQGLDGDALGQAEMARQ